MAHTNTMLAQLLKLVSRHEFEVLANRHHEGQRLRKISRWGQFVALLVGQLSGRSSLRDIIDNVRVQKHKMYHCGVGQVSRSSLARVNERQPWTLYQDLFGKLLSKCRNYSPAHTFRFKNPLYSMDASTIDLSLSVFPWADFRKKKGAIKIHVGLDHKGLIPAFMTVTEGNCQDIQEARKIDLPRGSILAVDRGYNDYKWFSSLENKGIFFVTRLKNKTRYKVLSRALVDRSSGISSDQMIDLTSKKGVGYRGNLRRIGYYCLETQKQYYFLTNNTKLCAKTIAAIYKDRWQIELFFKSLKQQLKVKSFLGTSKNALLSQLWIALIAYLMLSYLKFRSKFQWSVYTLMEILPVNIFSRRFIWDWLNDPFHQKSGTKPPANLQLKFNCV